ncbi:MAG TPA: hypothetical protein VFN51_02740 [Candidatus Saccharimonadales bacterium]|nr:hypothetical protein [Candidatus Saccharimonadales bacterium]
MTSYKRDQGGFSAVEGLLIVVIVALLAFVGWYVYSSNKKASDTINTANHTNTAANSVSRSSTKTATAAGARAKLIATGMLAYSNANPKASLNTFVSKHVNDMDFTASFKDMVDSGKALVASNVNPVSCSSSETTGFTVASSTLSGDSATVVLHQLASSGSAAQPQSPQLMLQYAGGTWSVNQYSCIAS